MTGPEVAGRAFVLLIGPFAGDFAATLAVAWPRLPRLLGRSTCARCGARIAATRQIPIVSWALSRGRRTCCGGRIPIAYPLGEAAGLASGLAAALAPGPALEAWSLAVGVTLTYIALVDLRRFSIPLWGLAALGAEAALALAAETSTAARLARLATGAVLALGFETLRRLVRRQGRAGLGVGDVLLAAVLGALVSWRLAAPMLVLATLAPLALQLARRRTGPTPFGLWLSVSAGALLLLVEFGWIAE